MAKVDGNWKMGFYQVYLVSFDLRLCLRVES